MYTFFKYPNVRDYLNYWDQGHLPDWGYLSNKQQISLMLRLFLDLVIVSTTMPSGSTLIRNMTSRKKNYEIKKVLTRKILIRIFSQARIIDSRSGENDDTIKNLRTLFKCLALHHKTENRQDIRRGNKDRYEESYESSVEGKQCTLVNKINKQTRSRANEKV